MNIEDMNEYKKQVNRSNLFGCACPFNVDFNKKTGEITLIKFDIEKINKINVINGLIIVNINDLIIKFSNEYCKNGQNKPLFYGVEKDLLVKNEEKQKTIDYSNLFSGYNGKRLRLVGFGIEQEILLMNGMFKGCRSLIELNLRRFNTSKVIDMSHMFCGCVSIEKLDLSSFDISSLEKTEYMFYKCNSLVEIQTPKKSGSIVPELPEGEWIDDAGKVYTTLPANVTESTILKKRGE